ncbi:hypothetical protein HZB89_01485 [archaeon]|nr:hypothetical protein [archaeon]
MVFFLEAVEESMLNEIIGKLNFLIERSVKQKKLKKKIFLQEALEKISKVKGMVLEEQQNH